MHAHTHGLGTLSHTHTLEHILARIQTVMHITHPHTHFCTQLPTSLTHTDSRNPQIHPTPSLTFPPTHTHIHTSTFTTTIRHTQPCTRTLTHRVRQIRRSLRRPAPSPASQLGSSRKRHLPGPCLREAHVPTARPPGLCPRRPRTARRVHFPDPLVKSLCLSPVLGVRWPHCEPGVLAASFTNASS